MATDDLMILFASCGLALTLIYLAGELIHWAAIKAANRLALIQARILYKKLHTVNTADIRANQRPDLPMRSLRCPSTSISARADGLRAYNNSVVGAARSHTRCRRLQL